MTEKGIQVDYRNVKQNQQWLDEMLRWSEGAREVPVIVKDGKLEGIGWGGLA